MIVTRLIYALWIILVIYLTVSAIGVKRETEGHLGQSFGLLFAIITSFLLPYLPFFRFLNFAPINPVLSTIGVILCVAGMGVLVWAGRASARIGARLSPRRSTMNW
jgi:protein-S-isoprenylcysteine O-methyltransferase